MSHPAVQDTIVRMALTMWQLDPKADLSVEQRQWLHDRLQVVDAQARPVAFTPEERRKVTPPLLAYLREHRPSIAPLVAAQYPLGKET